MKKRLFLLPVFALFVLLLSAIPVLAEQSGDWEYELSEVGLTITAYHGSDKEVVIPNEIDGYKVSAIGKQAFADNTSITSVVIPEGVANIYAEAFYGCAGLSKVEFNAKNCTVVPVQIYDDNKGAGIFSGAGSASAKGLKVVFGEKVAKVPDYLFDTASIDEYAHSGFPYAYVTSVTFSKSVKEIGACSFRGCRDLETIEFSGSEKTIDNNAFLGCASVKELSFGEALTTIGDYAFYANEGLESISWGTNLDSIGKYAFGECTCLEKAAFVNPITTIDNCAFINCTSLKEVLLPETLSNLNAEVFYGCINLNLVEINSTNLKVPGVQIYDENKGAGVFSGAGSASAKGLEVVFGPKVAKVPNHLFDTASIDEYARGGYPYAYVTDITFSEGVKEIGDSAFLNCQALETIKFAESTQSIGSYAFYGCCALEKLTFKKDLTTIGEGAFKGCTALEKIIWGTNLDTIEKKAFSGCTALTKVHFVDPLTTIGTAAFSSCTALEKVILPKTLTSLGGEAFYECTKLNQVIIQSVNLTASSVWIYDENKGCGIFSGAGSGSTTGLEVVFYTGVTKVPDFIFDTASIDEYGHGGYAYAYVTSVVCASTVKEVGESAFRSCQNLETVHFYNQDVTFGENAFYNCISPSFQIEGPAGGILASSAAENELKFVQSSRIEAMPEIEEPETAEDEAEDLSVDAVDEEEALSTEAVDEDEEALDAVDADAVETWTCSNGHTGNTGNFCPECGEAYPGK